MSQVRYCDHSQRPNERRAVPCDLGRAFVTGSSRRGRCEPVPTGRAVEGRGPSASRAAWSPSAAVPSSAAHGRPTVSTRAPRCPPRWRARPRPRRPSRSPNREAAGGRPPEGSPDAPSRRRFAAIGACVAVVLALVVGLVVAGGPIPPATAARAGRRPVEDGDDEAGRGRRSPGADEPGREPADRRRHGRRRPVLPRRRERGLRRHPLRPRPHLATRSSSGWTASPPSPPPRPRPGQPGPRRRRARRLGGDRRRGRRHGTAGERT